MTTFSTTPPVEKMSPPILPRWRALTLIGIFLAIFLIRIVDVQPLLQQTLTGLAGQGIAGMLIYLLLYILASLFFFPGMVLTMGAGAVWGVALGTPLALLGATLGASLAFFLGRYVAHDWVKRQIVHYPKFLRLDTAMADQGWKIVALTRLSPAFPFAFLNYAYGVTRIGFGQYVLTTGLFMIPGALLYTNIGAVAGGVIRGARTTAEWMFLVTGLLATIAVTIVVSRIARGSLDQTLATKEKEGMNVRPSTP